MYALCSFSVSQCLSVILTACALDLHAKPSPPTCTMDALALGLAGQTMPRTCSPKVGDPLQLVRLPLNNSSNPKATPSTYANSLATSYGPSPQDSTSRGPSGITYGPTVQYRAEQNPQGDWDERTRIYSEGLALGKWRPTYPCYRAPLWKSAPGSAVEGAFSYPVHVVFGIQDVALDPRIVLHGIDKYMMDSGEGMRKVRAGDEEGTDVHVVGRSSVTKLWQSGHWAMLDEQGARVLENMLGRFIGMDA
jgi:hypothetical protein